MVQRIFAHSLPGRPESEWEPLSEHLTAVGNRAARFAEAFGWSEAARVAGRLHDIGKCSRAFQDYIAQPTNNDKWTRGPDHSTAGAREAHRLYGDQLGKMLAFAIAGHHAGLADGEDLKRRVDPRQTPVQDYGGWQGECGELPPCDKLKPSRPSRPGVEIGFSPSFLTRMVFSCLVDADFLETERFYSDAAGDSIERGRHTELEDLRERLRAYMAELQHGVESTVLNALRARVREHATDKADLAPGLFTLTVPTGGGKTLASLSFALEHAVQYGLRRVIYVIPYTSIIEQTAAVFRKALGTDSDVLEHHSAFDWEQARQVAAADSEGPSGIEKLRRAAENWDVPVVVTTAVQFFESLFAKRTSACRKLHNIARSVVILDEVQMLPLKLLRPCVAAIDELARNYGTSLVLCTATQPALRRQDVDAHKWGLDTSADRELAPDPASLYRSLKRVIVEKRGATTDEEIAERFAEQDRMLCIVNSRAHAKRLFDSVREMDGAFHLSTLMCPKHRRCVLGEVRKRLERKQPVRLVATSLIEAGVDIDFPEVWRAAAGVDSIAQAAGRCNREATLICGRTVVFEAAEVKSPFEVAQSAAAAQQVLRQYEDILCLESVLAYFRELYWRKGPEHLDSAVVGGRPGILAAIRERGRNLDFPFESIAKAFHMIDERTEPVAVPWKSRPGDTDADDLLHRIRNAELPRRDDLRQLQQYLVSIPQRVCDEWMTTGVITPVHPALKKGLLRFADLAHYRPETGLDIYSSSKRDADLNVIS